ncbi:efflux RND transporter permease subunit [Shewanella yunxiaonensis]|uniref:Efflux RND transporter permease subunit n=2 Tax=Shewanella yunxiaonensis TaxID=2829809 RepID=A0ABX7YXG9_9GAMM|nr:efflux RND transporter permease subunit [Shewanella yunxiaonensis]
MILLIFSLLGIIGYLNMPRNMFPDIERPQVTVITALPGASALTVTQKVAQPMEQELWSLAKIRDVQTVNKNEVSIVRTEFDYQKGLDAALIDVNNALSRVRSKLPVDTPSSSVYATGGFTNPVMTLALSPKPGSALNLETVRLIAENDIRAAFVTQPHIANVEVFGGYEPAVRVEFDPMRLARYHLDASKAQDILTKLNRDWPLGIAKNHTSALTVTVYGERASVDALRSLPLLNGVRLGDVATLSLSHGERFSAYHGNGKDAIAVSIQRPPSGAVQAAIDDANAVIPRLQARYPNIEFSVADTQGELIQTSNSNMVEALRDAILFTSVVILFFLGNWRAVVTALVSIPLVFLATMGILWLLGRELNILVMTGIILALGMLVDDAVVVLENIERHLGALHEKVEDAIVYGTREVLGPIFIGTLATAAVIAPLMAVGELPQQLFKHLILTVIIAVFVSWFIAVTFIPRLSAFWYRNGLPPKNTLERFMERLYQRGIAPHAAGFERLLSFSFAGRKLRRWLLILPAFVLLVVSLKIVMPLIGRDALPPMDTGLVKVHVKFSANDTVESAEKRLTSFEADLMKDPRIKRISVAYGSEPGVLSMGAGQLPAEAIYTLAYVNRQERKQTSWQIEANLRQKLNALPGIAFADVFDSGVTVLSTVKAPVDIRLYAEDWRQLPAAAVKVKIALQKVPGITSISSTWDADANEAHIVFNEDKLRALNLTPEAVISQLPIKGISGASLSKLPTVTALPVRLYFKAPYRNEPENLLLLPIQLANGKSIPLGQVAQVERVPGVAVITTNGMRYTLDILAYRNTAPISFIKDAAVLAASKVLPASVTYAEMGDDAEGSQSSKRMLIGLGTGVLLLFGILVPAYRSFSLGALSVLILPLSAIGAVWGLLAFGKAMAMPAILGIVLLFSIVIKNSILMVDFIRERREAGANAYDAAVEAIRLRYRPILMTAFGTIAGMIPIAMQRAVGLERLSPLADATIGGLLVGTVLSLFYLPMFYVWLTNVNKPSE